MEQLNAALAVTGAVVICVGVLSNVMKRSLVQDPIFAVGVGVAVGPHGLGLLDVASWGDQQAILEQAARLTLAIGLMGVALRIRRASFKALWRPVTVLVAIGMVGTWLVSSALATLVLGISFWTALLVGAVVTPTDPVVASSIVTGPFARQHLPLRVRDAISFESGANDGLAYLLVMLPVLVLVQASGAWSRWIVEALVVGVIVAAVLGVVIGYAAAKLLALAERRKWLESTSFLGYTLAFSLFALGVAAVLGAEALLSVFLAGLVFNLYTPRREEHEEEHVQEAVAKLLTVPMFVIFGIALPLDAWAHLGWPLLGFVVLVLLLRRPPVVAAIYPALRHALGARDVAFVGWFGPIGIAAVYYAVFAGAHLDEPLIWHVASALILASILVHGASAAPLTRLYARRQVPEPAGTRGLGRDADDGDDEDDEVIPPTPDGADT
jgi:sodium/hydrogen antiporter